MITYRAFFGDTEHGFRLTFPLLKELEKSTGLPSLALFTRIFNRDSSAFDLTETIRLALIGGGTHPARAAELVAAYATDRPFAEIYPLAFDIAQATWFGTEKENDGQA